LKKILTTRAHETSAPKKIQHEHVKAGKGQINKTKVEQENK
jgi:hypothetical protein